MPYLLKAEPFDEGAGATRVLHFSDIGFTTEPHDAPANTYWTRRIDAPMTMRRSLFNGSAIGGYSATSFGSAILANDDGALDGLADLDWDGRPVEIWYTPVERPVLADFAKIFDGTAEGIVLGDDLEIQLRDLQVLLDAVASRGTFAGTGGVEGSAELKGREKPWLLGRRRQIEPVLIDATRNIYMIDPAGYHALSAVRDLGITYTAPGPDVPGYAELAALSMAGIDYATCKRPGFGLIRTRTRPAGRFTVDAEGVVVDGVWIHRFADLVRHVVTAFTSLTAASLREPSFTAMNLLQPAVLGYWSDGSSSRTVRAVVDELADTVGGFWGFDEQRRLAVGRYDAPAAEADFHFDGRDILDLSPRAVERRMRSLRLGYRPFSTLLSEKEMDNATPAADREAFQNDTRWTETATHAGVAAASLLARDEEARTLFDEAAAAIAERDRRLALHGPRRKAFEVVVPLTPGLEVGATVRLTDARYGLAGGRNFRVLETERDASTELHKLTVIG